MVPLRGATLLVLISCSILVEGAQRGNRAQNTLKEKKIKHPCDGKICDAGTLCVVKSDRTAACECVTECRPETDERRKVCSNYNATFDSLCHLHQMACWCRQGAEGCIDEEYEHLHPDYFGTCRDIPKCSSEEMSDFPRRMREWLFNIMKDLAQKKSLDPNYEKLEKEAEQNHGHHGRQWVNAVIWKYCDLDTEPANRVVSRHELYPLKAPLLAMEHCIAPFLDSCDADNDHQVTLKEWGLCLGLEVEEIQDKCQSMHEGREF